MADVGIRISATDATQGAFASVSKSLGLLDSQASLIGNSLKSVIGGLAGSLTVGAFVGLIKGATDAIDRLNDLKDATGASIENISALERVARRTGANFDTVASSLVKFNLALSNSKPGSDAELAITALGLSVAELKAQDPALALQTTAKALATFADDGNKARITQELFGKSLREVAPLLKDLAESGKLVSTVTTAQAEEAEKFNKQLAILKFNSEETARSLANSLLPTLNKLFEDFNTFNEKRALAGAASDVLKFNKELEALEKRKSSPFNFSANLDAEIEKIKPKLAQAKELFKSLDVPRDKPVADDSNRPSVADLAALAAAAAAAKVAAAAAAAAAAEQQAKANQGLKLYNDLLSEATGFSGNFAEQTGLLATAFAKGRFNLTEFAAAYDALLAQQPGAKAALKDLADLTKASQLRQQTLLKEADAIREFVSQTEASYLARARASEDAVVAAQNEYDAFEKTKSQLAQITLLRLQDELRKFTSGTVGYESTQREIEAQKELIQILQKGEVREAAAVSAKEAAEEWKRVAVQIEQSLTDALLRGFESGKGFIANFRDSIVNMFKTLVLRPIISAVVNPVAQGITGALGLSGASSAANAASTASSLAGMGSFASGFANGLSAWGSGGSVSAMAANPSLYTAAELAGAAGPIAAAIIATYIVAKGMNGGESRSGGSYNIGSDGKVYKSQGPSGGEIAADTVRTATDTTTATITKLLASFGSSATLTGWMSGLEASTQGKGFVYAGGSINGRSFGESDISQRVYQRGNMTQGRTYMDEAGNTQTLGGGYDGQFTDQQALQGYATDLQRSILQALQVADLGGAIGSYVTALGDVEAMTADNVSTTLAQVTAYGDLQAALKGLPFDYLKNASVEASAAIIDAAGGIESLGSKLGSYYANFYSDTERTELTLASLGKTLGDVGLTLPTTRDGFRDLVEAQNLNTEAGRAGYTTLLSVADAFAGVVPASTAAAEAVTQISARLESLKKENLDLQDQYDQLTLSQAAYRDKLVKGYSAEEQAAARVNFAIQDKIAAYGAEQKAASDAAAKAKQIADERAGLEQQILQLTGNTAALRQIELAGLDASNQALQLRIYALQDEATAAQAAAQAASDAAAKTKQIADQRSSLEQQILQLEGNTAALRLIELAGLDASNQALQLRINALKDEATAAQAAAQAQADAAAKAKQIADQRSSLEQQILQLTGNTAALRQLELAGLDASNRALQLRIYALQDEATAAQAAAQAQAEAAAKAKQIADERAGLEQQILQLTGNTAALRQLELASLDESNRALQLRIYALQDEAAAAAKAAAAQEQYRAALEEANNFLASFARNIQTYVGKLNATPAGMQSPERQLLSARDQYNEQLSLARQGNRDAMGSITQFADQYINAGAARASTRAEAAQIVNQIKRELSALPAQIRPEDLIIAAIREQTPIVTSALDTYLSRTSQLIVSGFGGIDLNTDGLLTFEELKQAGLANDSTIEAMILLIDTNNDGMVSLIEAQIGATQSITDALLTTIAGKFDAIDLNVDGLIDMTELRNIFGSVASDTTLQAIIKAIDTNGDGQISKLEAIKASSNQIKTDTSNGVVPALQAMSYAIETYLNSMNLRSGYQLVSLEQINAKIDAGITVKSEARSALYPVYFAQGGYVDRATAFGLGSGIGIMGEAGGEFILPAARMANGQMGVQASMPDLSIYSKPEANAAALLAEIRNLREEVAQLRSESRAGDQAIASATAKTAKILERVTPDGASLQTVAAP